MIVLGTGYNSRMAWRGAIIANSLLGRQVYDVNGESSVFDLGKTDA